MRTAGCLCAVSPRGPAATACHKLKGLHSHPRLNYRHAAVKTLIEMPLDDYNALLAKCPATDREYEILKNGLITPYGEGNDQA